MWNRKDTYEDYVYERVLPEGKGTLKVNKRAFDEPEWGKPNWRLTISRPDAVDVFKEMRSYGLNEALIWADSVLEAK